MIRYTWVDELKKDTLVVINTGGSFGSFGKDKVKMYTRVILKDGRSLNEKIATLIRHFSIIGFRVHPNSIPISPQALQRKLRKQVIGTLRKVRKETKRDC